LFDAGVTVTINSDDPFFFGNRLSEEYYALHQELGFSLAELAQIAGNGFEVALVDEIVRKHFQEELMDFCSNKGLAG
jgi:adenosine deaminase